MRDEVSDVKTFMKGRFMRCKIFTIRIHAKFIALCEKYFPISSFEKRISVVAPYFDILLPSQTDPTFRDRRELASHYLKNISSNLLNPNQLFDGNYYCSQIPEAHVSGLTLLEHYILTGFKSDLDPSPFFSTAFYLDTYPDVKNSGINPLLHYIKWGINEGRDAFPLTSEDLTQRIHHANASANSFGLAYQAIAFCLDKNFKEALKSIRKAKNYLPIPFYLKVCGICFCLAQRFLAAELIFKRISHLPGMLDIRDIFSNTLIQAGGLARSHDQVDLAYKNYVRALENGYRFENSTLYEFGSFFFSKGQFLIAVELIDRVNKGRSVGQSEIRQMRMVSVKSHCLEANSFYHEFLAERTIGEAPLKFANAIPVLTSRVGDLIAPPFYLAVLGRTKTFSGCNIVLTHDSVVLDGISNKMFPHAVLADNYKNHHLIQSRYRDQALVSTPEVKPVFIDKGLKMFGVASRNYGHWFLEYLPRMIAYESEMCGGEFPIVVDADMPKSHLESLNLLNSRKRQIVTLPANQAIEFAALGLAPVPAFFPLDIDGGDAYDTVWPQDIFSQLKTLIIEGLKRENFVFSTAPRRLFISRKNFSSRQLVNEVEVEKVLHELGFTTVHPETMTFAEQVDAFRSASVVVGSSSSALTNAIFCNPGARVVALINDCPDFNFRGYSSFIESGGSEILFVQGPSCPDQQKVHRFHRSYKVSIDDVRTAVYWAMR